MNAAMVTWITGASSGLGEALALTMARAGHKVVISARRQEALDEIAAREPDLNIGAVALDVADRAATAEAVARIEREFGPIGVAVLNAGTHKPDDASALDAGAFGALIDVNLMGAVNGLEAVLPPMLGRGSGRVAVVSSVAGYVGLPYASAYGASKAALINMCESLNPQLRAKGVVLQLVCPGFVDTPLTKKNDFPMPFLMPVDKAAEAFRRGLESDRFEIVFPRRMGWVMSLLRTLPYPLFFALTKRMLRS